MTRRPPVRVGRETSPAVRIAVHQFAPQLGELEPDQEVVFRARALENECVVVVGTRAGSENDWRCFGRSLVVGPRGRIVARASGTETLLLADVELAPGAADPELSYLARRRPEVYRPLVEPLAQPAGSGPVRAS